MRTWARWTAQAAMFTASFVAAGAGSVGIASAGTTSGNNSIGGGNQVSVPISIPVNVCGNAIAVLGDAFAFCKGGASVSHDSGDGSSAGPRTSGNESILGGNQVSAPISVPVNVCGNAIALLGDASAFCKGGASVSRDSGDSGDGSSARTSGNESILGGNQVRVPVNAPVNVCGNAVNSPAFCKGGASVHTEGSSSEGAGPRTSGNESILGGNQVFAPVSVPVNVCGNAVAVLGDAFAFCKGGAWTGSPMSSSSSGMTHLLAQRSYGAGAMPARSVVQQSALTGAAAGLTRLPVLAGLAGLGGSVSQVAGSSAGTARPAQGTLLSASSPAAPGMGSGSLFALAFGALLAGAASLIAAGRRLSIRKAGR